MSAHDLTWRSRSDGGYEAHPESAAPLQRLVEVDALRHGPDLADVAGGVLGGEEPVGGSSTASLQPPSAVSSLAVVWAAPKTTSWLRFSVQSAGW